LVLVTEQSTSSASASASSASASSASSTSTSASASTSDPSSGDRSDDADDLPEQMRVRREKRQRLLDAGRDPYPVAVARTHTLAEVRAAFNGLEAGTSNGTVVGVTGRVVFVRNTGKLCFATLQEGDGTRLQAMLSLAEVGEQHLAAWKSDVDLGDHVFVSGEVISSKRGELSVLVREWQIAAKALRPLPVLHKDMSEESRVRRRYVDLVVRPAARDVVRTRAGVVRALRESFQRRSYLEVETPMLQVLHGGAAARPFVTHMNAFDIDLYLRIAPAVPQALCGRRN
jgi:lysyl-tRNA synthetase class 2